jgi:hypothetical protein
VAPLLPAELTEAAYAERVVRIFGPALDAFSRKQSG